MVTWFTVLGRIFWETISTTGREGADKQRGPPNRALSTATKISAPSAWNCQSQLVTNSRAGLAPRGLNLDGRSLFNSSDVPIQQSITLCQFLTPFQVLQSWTPILRPMKACHKFIVSGHDIVNPLHLFGEKGVGGFCRPREMSGVDFHRGWQGTS